MDELKKKLIAWLLDIIDTETSKPDDEANMELVEECIKFLEELNS